MKYIVIFLALAPQPTRYVGPFDTDAEAMAWCGKHLPQEQQRYCAVLNLEPPTGWPKQ